MLPVSSNGYLKLDDMQQLSDLAHAHDLQLELQVEVGAFVVEGRPLIRLTRDLAQEPELAQQLQGCFVFSLDELLHRYLTPIRTYGSQDLQVNVRLLRCLESLILADCSSRHQVGALSHHAMAVVYSAQESLKNPVDNARLNEMIHHLNTTLPDVLNLNFLEV